MHNTKFIFVPTNESEYNQLVVLLDDIIDVVRDDERHPLVKIMDLIGVLIEDYEKAHYPEPDGHPLEALKYFMEEFEVTAQELPELGNHDVVTAILNGERDLNLRQIRALSTRFNAQHRFLFRRVFTSALPTLKNRIITLVKSEI
ncbi:MAG: transcriptional regulator [Chloroflexota bacterium]